MRLRAVSSRTWLLVLLLAGSVAGAAFVGIRHYYSTRDAVYFEARNALSAIAKLKAGQIAAWKKERISDARTAQNNVMAMAALRRVIYSQADARTREQVRTWLDTLLRQYDYENLLLVDRLGALRFAVGAPLGDALHLAEAAREVIAGGRILFRDFRAGHRDGRAHLGINIPLRETPQGDIFGAMLIGVDPERFLYPLLQEWPTQSPTAETLLIRREGDQVVYLNELRHRKGTALRLRRSLGDSRLPAALAATGREGVVEGTDYRGAAVLAALRKVPDSNWFLVAKIDLEEVRAPIRRQLLYFSAFLGGLLLALAGGVAFVWRGEQSAHYRKLYTAELDRRALEGHYGYLARSANDAIFLLDDSGRIVEVNDRAYSLYGYQRAELLAMHASDLRHPDAAAAFQREWEEVDEQGTIFETLHRRKDGACFPVEVSARLIRVDGVPYRQAIVRDISARRAMEEALRERTDTLTALFDAAPIGVAALRPDGTVTFWNRAAERIFGFTSQEAVGRLLPIVPPEAMQEFLQLKERVLQGNSFTDLELRRRRKDGSMVDISVSTAPLHDPQDRINGILAVWMDISQKKAAEQSLRESEERYRRLVENAPVGILIQAGGRFRYLNPEALRIFGATSPEQILGQPVLERFHADDHEKIRERIRLLNEEQRSVPMIEERCLRLDGSEVPVEVSAVSYRHNGENGALVFVLDISERKRREQESAILQEQYRQAQKMESIGRLAGGVAHDFNNHLTVINGYCDLLLERLPAGDPIREQLVAIRQSGRHAADLTRQLLAFSRKQAIDPVEIDINEIVADAERMLRRLIGESIVLETDLAPGAGFVRADPVQITQVLVNLVINARDAMPDGGRIVVETSRAELDERYAASHSGVLPGSYVLLSVSDSGVGMDELTMQQIFEPFFTTRRASGGTGLGLSMVYGIVRQSNGWIWVYSEPGEGTTFKVYLPRVAAVSAPTARPASPASVRGRETILVVEDQEEVRRLAVRILEHYGYHVLEAGGGSEALEVSAQYAGPIHLVLTDVMMPAMTGRQLAEKLVATRPGTAVLYTSGYTANVIAHQGVLDEGVAYLPKPYTPEQLARKVREVLGAPAVSATILVVDDEEPIRRLIRTILERAGYAVLEASDGEDALRILSQSSADLVITDLVMPGREGLETILALRSTRPQLKIIAMSGAFGGEFLQVAREFGALSTLLKPLTPEQLLAAVASALGGG